MEALGEIQAICSQKIISLKFGKLEIRRGRDKSLRIEEKYEKT